MIKNQALGGRSNKALIFLGLFLGIVSAGLAVYYLSKADEGGGQVSSGATTSVVVASRDVVAGTRITEEMVTVKPIASEAVLTGAFTDAEDVVGQVTRVPLVANEQVIPSKVTATGAAIADVEDPPLAYVIPEGKRAVSVSVSSVNTASGLIRPGDFVDVILTIRFEQLAAPGEETDQDSRVRDQLALTILQNAQVLSIDQEVARTVVTEDGGDGAALPESGEANPDLGTVTLAVSPVHGEVLTVAQSCGENFGGGLSLALRAFGDSTPLETRTVWAENGAPPSCAALLGLPSLQ